MKTVRQLEIEDELRMSYGGMMTMADVGNELGIHNRDSIKDFLNGTPAYDINGRKRWRTRDVARLIAYAEVE